MPGPGARPLGSKTMGAYHFLGREGKRLDQDAALLPFASRMVLLVQLVIHIHGEPVEPHFKKLRAGRINVSF